MTEAVDQPDGEQSAIVFNAENDEASNRLEFAFKLLQQENLKAEQVEGRRYTKVVDRVSVFRRAFGPLASIVTDITHADEDVVRCRAEVHLGDRMVATGHAEEFRNAHELNWTSALENAETSAIGRALANLGLHGGEFATADELLSAKAAVEELRKAEATRHILPEEVAASVAAINACTNTDDLAATYARLSPALKVAADAAMSAKFRQLSSQTSGSEPAKDASPAAPSVRRSASPRRAAPKHGAD